MKWSPFVRNEKLRLGSWALKAIRDQNVAKVDHQAPAVAAVDSVGKSIAAAHSCDVRFISSSKGHRLQLVSW